MDRIDLQINKKLESIKKNPDYKKILLPEYIYEDQDEVIIYNTKSTKYNSKSNTKITYMLDCTKGRKEYLNAFRNKTLVVPAEMHYLIISNYEPLECYLDLSKAVDLEY